MSYSHHSKTRENKAVQETQHSWRINQPWDKEIESREIIMTHLRLYVLILIELQFTKRSRFIWQVALSIGSIILWKVPVVAFDHACP